MRQSMTGFASAQGGADGLRWAWDLRSVNGKGLDLRLRVPDWIEGLEQALRAELAGVFARGSVTVSLRVSAETEAGTLVLNPAQMRAALSAMAEVEAEAMERGLTLGPSTAADVVALRGVMDAGAELRDTVALRAVLVTEFRALVAGLVAARTSEGAALSDILQRHINEIEAIVQASHEVVIARKDEQAERLRQALARVMEAAPDMDEARIAQELALIAVKSDVTEEIDRLTAHIAAARDLLQADGAVGRKFDFLMQEFNREANTLCSKAQSTPLTQLGLELKTVIDQMREQVQNVE